MNITDIFTDYKNHPKCLYCKSNLMFTNWSDNSLKNWTEEFQCLKCNEFFTVVLVNSTLNSNFTDPTYFLFTLNNEEFFIDLKKEKIAIPSQQNLSFDKQNWYTIFDLNFLDKKALSKKIKMYTLFS